MSAGNIGVWIRRLFKLGLILLIVVGIVGFAMRGKIIAKVLTLAETSLAERGLYIEHGSHELSVRRGVVLKDLALFLDPEKQERVAVFDNLGIRIPVMGLLDRDSDLTITSERGELGIQTSAGELKVEDIDFDLVLKSGLLRIDGFTARLNGLRVTSEGAIQWEHGASEDGGEVDPASPPRLELPDLSPLVKVAPWFEIPEGEPTLAIRIEPAEDGVKFSGDLKGEDFRWKNLMLDRASLHVGLSEGAVLLSDVSLDCYGGKVSGELLINYADKKLEIRNAVCSADPFRFVGAFLKGDTLKSFGVAGETIVRGEKLVLDLNDMSRSKGTLSVKSPAGVIIPSHSRQIVLTDFDGEVRFSGGQLLVDGKRFNFCGGPSKGSYTLPLSGGYRYKLKIASKGISLPQVGRSAGLKKEMAGVMNLDFNGGGAKGIRSHYGSGQISVSGGQFYAVPLVGSFRAFISAKSPQFKPEEAGDLSATYSLKNGVLSSSDLRVESKTTVMFVRGDIDLAAKTVDGSVRANLKGVAGLATGVFSHILEVHGEGPMDNVRWTIAKMPSAVGDVSDAAVDAIKGTAEGVGKAVEEVGDAVGGLLKKRPGALIPKKKTPPNKK